jgi:hypothetical protein
MKVATSIASPSHCLSWYSDMLTRLQVLQAFLVAMTLAITVLRCWIRLRIEHRNLTLPDYLVWGGWFFTVGWFLCSAIALHIQIDHPILPENDHKTDSVSYMVVCTMTHMWTFLIVLLT